MTMLKRPYIIRMILFTMSEVGGGELNRELDLCRACVRARGVYV